MKELKDFVVLQARLYEFLQQQDETTLRALVSGAARLTVVSADDARTPAGSAPREGTGTASRPASSGLTMVPTRDPVRAAQDLSRLASERERRIYLNAAKLQVKELREVAKRRGLVAYSRLTHAKLMDLLAEHGPDQTDALAGEPSTPAPPSSDPVASPDPVDGGSDVDQQTSQEARPSSKAQSTEVPSTGTTRPEVDVATIASRLRETETEEEGTAYLRTQHLDRDSLLAVAAELQLTRVNRLKQAELEKRVLKQAIGARRKFAGLRKW